MKKYYMTVPQQPKDKFHASVYENPGGSPALECRAETHFPIIPLILNTAEKGERIAVFAVRPDNPNTVHCLETLRAELGVLGERGISYDLELIDTPGAETVENHLALFGRLISSSADGDRVYADITFGTKPIPMLLLMFMNFMYKFRRDACVENVIYGSFDFTSHKSALYDVTALFYMNSTVNTMPASSADPEGFIRAVLEM